MRLIINQLIDNKQLISKLVLECEDETSNKTETSLKIKK